MGSFDVFSQELEAMMGMGLVEMLISEIPTMLINLAVYIFTGLGFYTIAKRRGIHNPWLAWVPIANMWLLGCISDHYQSVANGKVTRRRVVLLVTQILLNLAAVAVIVLCFVMLGRMFAFIFETFGNLGNLENLDMLDEAAAQQLLSAIMGPGVGMVLLSLVLLPVSIVNLVFYCLAMHNVYKSCEPDNATLYLVLGIFIGICVPIFLMVCRNKDEGMPIRAPQPAYYPSAYDTYEQNPYQPPYGMPPQPPVQEPQKPREPWEREGE